MKINGFNFLIGADPEFFVKRDGVPVSAHGLIEGTKDAPKKVRNGAVQVDGMALEFNIDPAGSFVEFEENMVSVLSQIKAMVPGYEAMIEPIAEFGAEYIKKQPKEARELGCSPDYNAYTKRENPRPNVDAPFRTASGHIHIGWTKDVDPMDEGHFEACCTLTKALDIWLGIPSLVWDADDRRRSLYGAAGAFRPKPYGMEYRVLSNKWIDHPQAPHLRKAVYYNTIEAIKATFSDPEWVDKANFGGVTPQAIVNKTSDQWETAATLALKYGNVKPSSAYR